MSAVGAISGEAVYSELIYKERTFRVAQWYLDAMDAVCTFAFRLAGHGAQLLGGDAQAVARREASLARLWSMGAFNFDAILDDGGIDNTPEMKAVFLFKLLVPHDATVTLELAREMVKNAPDAVTAAIRKANPQNALTSDPATAVPTPPAPVVHPAASTAQ